MYICGHNADTTSAVKKVTKVYHTVVQFLKNNLIQFYSLVCLHIHTCHRSDYILRHRAYRENIYYCRELDNEARISPGGFGKITEWVENTTATQ